MKAKELLRILQNSTPEELDMDLTVYTAGNGEYFPIDGVWEIVEDDENDVLNVGSLVLIVQN